MSELFWLDSKGSRSSNACPFRIVMNSIPQSGQGTNWYSPAWSNLKVSLHLGHVKVVEPLIFCIFPLVHVYTWAFVDLRNILVDCSNYIEYALFLTRSRLKQHSCISLPISFSHFYFLSLTAKRNFVFFLCWKALCRLLKDWNLWFVKWLIKNLLSLFVSYVSGAGYRLVLT